MFLFLSPFSLFFDRYFFLCLLSMCRPSWYGGLCVILSAWSIVFLDSYLFYRVPNIGKKVNVLKCQRIYVLTWIYIQFHTTRTMIFFTKNMDWVYKMPTKWFIAPYFQLTVPQMSIMIIYNSTWSIFYPMDYGRIVRWQSDHVNTKKAYLLCVINLITLTKEKYKKGGGFRFFGTVH